MRQVGPSVTLRQKQSVTGIIELVQSTEATKRSGNLLLTAIAVTQYGKKLMSIKGQWRRACAVSKAEEALRWEYAYSDTMTLEEFNTRLREIRDREKYHNDTKRIWRH